MAVDDLREALEAIDPESMVPARWVLKKIGEPTRLRLEAAGEPAEPMPWSARLWTVPPETRLTVPQAAEALNRSTSWIYDHVSVKKVEDLSFVLPHRKEGGQLRFLAGELRAWVQANETRP